MYGRSMTGGAPWKHIILFSLPIISGMLLQQFYHTADTLIVGNLLGEEALAAVGTTNTFAFLLLSAALGFSAGNGVVVAQFYGAGNEKMVRRNAAGGIFFLFLLGLLCSLAGIFSARAMYTHWMAVPEEILEMTISYFRIYAAGIIFQFGYNVFSAVLRAVGDSAATLYFLLVASLLNVALDFLFVAGFSWGVEGAAWATGISQAASVAAAYWYMVKKYPVFRFKLKEFKWYTDVIKDTVAVGLPITLQMMVVALGFTFIQRAVNGFGKAMTASFTVGQRMEMYLHLPCNALQTTLATYTGQNVGAGRMDRVKKGALQGVAISVGVTVLLSVIIWSLSDNIVTWFALGGQAAGYCREHLQATVLLTVILSVYVPLFGIFQGTKHSVITAFTALMAFVVRVIVTYWFKDRETFGHTIIWWNSLFGFCTGFLICWSYYISKRWQKNASFTADRGMDH